MGMAVNGEMVYVQGKCRRGKHVGWGLTGIFIIRMGLLVARIATLLLLSLFVLPVRSLLMLFVMFPVNISNPERP